MMRIRTFTGWKNIFCNNPGDGDDNGIDLGDIGMDFGGGGEDPVDTPPVDSSDAGPGDPPATDDSGGADPADPVADSGTDDSPPVVDDPPAGDPPADGDPATPPTDPPAGDDPPVPDTMEELRRQLNELHAKILDGAPAAPVKPPEGDDPSAGDVGKGEEADYLGDLDIDDVVSKPELFNQVIQQAVGTAVQQALQAVVGNIAQLTQPVIRQTLSMDRKVESFFEQHPLLGNFRQVVGGIANQVQAQKPEASFDDLLPTIAEQAYKALQLNPEAVKRMQEQQQQQQQQTNTPRATGLPGSTSTRQPPPATPAAGLEDEIEDLINLR